MKQLALVVTLMFAFSFTQQVEAQTPPCCSPEWCKIFCGENTNKCSTVALKDCKPADCKKVAEVSCSPKSTAKVVNEKPSCSSKTLKATTNSKPKNLQKASAKKVSNKSTDPAGCCSWVPGCCVKPAKEKDDKC
jgi:hypothetical protein